MPDWCDWRKGLFYDEDGNLVDGHIRHDYETLTQQIRVDGEIWEATLEEQQEYVDAYRKELGL